ncbi:MAG: hypothetical protein AAF654_01445 [Myxococcota bacterium]
MSTEFADEIEVKVRAPGRMSMDRVFRTSDDLTMVDLEVPPGPEIEFTVIGRRTMSNPPMPVLWGTARIDVVPGDNELDVVVDPAGAVAVRLERNDGTPVRQPRTLELTPLDTEGFAVPRRITVNDGTARLPIVAGLYSVTLDDVVAEATLSVLDGTEVNLRWCAPEGLCSDAMITEECTGDLQCSGVAVCRNAACVAPPNVEFGASCNDSIPCEPGLSCLNGQCVRQNDQGCLNDEECAASCIQGTCQSPAPVGGECDSTGDCQPPNVCSALGICGAADVCTMNGDCPIPGESCVIGRCIGISQPGNECDDTLDCESGTCENGACVLGIGSSCDGNKSCLQACIGGQCTPRSPVGGLCDNSENNDCQIGLTCKSSMCLNRGPCDTDAECGPTENCVFNLCQPPLQIGRECSGDSDCQFGLGCVEFECRPRF